MNLTINILLDGKPATFKAKLHATYQKDASTPPVTSAPTDYGTFTMPWGPGTMQLFYDGPGSDTPSTAAFQDITPSDTQTSTGQDLTFNVNFVTSYSLYLGIGAVALATFFFFRKKMSSAIGG